MGRRKIVKITPGKEELKWVFAFGIDVDMSRLRRERIAFLSGLGRSYFPGDPGYSKFGLVYQLNVDDDSPAFTYTPPDDCLYGKPISNRGYGIGGLNAPRFAENHLAGNPSPDKYQREMGPELFKSYRKTVIPKDDIYRLPPNDPYVLQKRLEVARQRERQCDVSFGTIKSKPRFTRHPALDILGVGSYNIAAKGPPKSIASSAFGRSPITHELSTNIHCTCLRDQTCIECGTSLITKDYYRTRLLVSIPFPETRERADLGKDFPRGKAHINLCNVCYYRALIGNSTNWPKGNKLRCMFKKTRTCSRMMLDPQTPPHTKKSDQRTVRKLQMKESILSKYYEDLVEESIVKSYE